MVAAVLFIALVVTLVLNMPVGIAIGVSSLCAILADGRISSLYIVQQLVTSADSFPLMAIPLFILAGELMGAGGVSKRLLNVCNVFLGRFTGGLATVTIVLCMFFAAVSGSGPATVAAIGSMVIPTMLDKGYSKSFTLALIATAGSIGVIIPPSIPMVIYGVSTSTSISSLFMAGFLPGILIGFSLIVVSYLYCKKQGWKGDERKYTAKEKLAAIWDAKWALLNPIIILGGIYAGIFTPTEAAAVAAVYAFICGAFIYREFNIKEMFATIGNACNTTGTTMVIIGCATAFTKILTIEKIPGAITNFLGIRMEHEKCDYIRAVLEGVAMNLGIILEKQRENGEIQDLVLTGGGAKGDTLSQILADVLGVRLHRLDQVETATSVAAAVIAGIGVGVFKDFSVVDQFVKREKTFVPREEYKPVYDHQKKLFVKGYECLSDYYKMSAEE